MKKALFLLAVLAMMFTLPATAQKATIDGVTYEFNEPETGEATVVPSSNGNYSGEVFIPATVTYNGQEYSVTTIGDNAFKLCRKLTSVSMPYTIERLGDKAFFQCTGIITIRCDALVPPEIPNKNAFHNMDASRVTMIVPGQSIALYAAHGYWGEFIYNPADDNESADNETGTTIVTKTNYEIRDSETLFLEKPITIKGQDTDPTYNEYNMVSYVRNFKNTNWQALYVPVEFVYSDWSEKFEIAKIHSILETGSMFYAMADIVEDKVEPHQLYLIRAKETGEHTITVSQTHRSDTDGDPLHRVYTSNTDTLGTAPVTVTSESFKGASGATYTFTGQYAATALKEAVHTQPPYLYAMTGGELKRPNPSSATGIPLGAFRWWLQVTPETGAQGLMFSTGKIDHSGTTGVEGIMIDLSEIEGLDIYYDLNGRPVENPTNGIYIKNGKKILVK